MSQYSSPLVSVAVEAEKYHNTHVYNRSGFCKFCGISAKLIDSTLRLQQHLSISDHYCSKRPVLYLCSEIYAYAEYPKILTIR